MLHHVMVRGLDRQPIFRVDADRSDFLDRLADLAKPPYALIIYAWALLVDHVHLLVRTGTRPLSRAMRSLLTGYAGHFNRTHGRTGHLFQNRYKSILVEEEPYLLELVRYVHLNPVRAGAVPDLETLTRHPWTGHSALLATIPRQWQATQEVLAFFGKTPSRARKAYQQFVRDGIATGSRPELQGGGLVRSLGGWQAVRALGRGREAYLSDERVLGSTDFVEAVRQEMAKADPPRFHPMPLVDLVDAVCKSSGVTREQLAAPGRRRAVARARGGLAYLWVSALGCSAGVLAAAMGVRSQAVYQAVPRGTAERQVWESLLRKANV